MKTILSGIKGEATGTAFSTAIGGRLYVDYAPARVDYPFVVFSIVTGGQDDTFANGLEDYVIQFSIFHNSGAGDAVPNIYDALRAVYDDASITAAGYTSVMMYFNNLETMVDDYTSETGGEIIRHWAVDYRLVVQI